MSHSSRPTVPITIDGTEYKLYFDFNSVADTEAQLSQMGIEVNLLAARLSYVNAARARALFIAGLKVNQPEITVVEAFALYELADPTDLVNAIYEGYSNYLPPPKQKDEVKPPADPPRPGS